MLPNHDVKIPNGIRWVSSWSNKLNVGKLGGPVKELQQGKPSNQQNFQQLKSIFSVYSNPTVLYERCAATFIFLVFSSQELQYFVTVGHNGLNKGSASHRKQHQRLRRQFLISINRYYVPLSSWNFFYSFWSSVRGVCVQENCHRSKIGSYVSMLREGHPALTMQRRLHTASHCMSTSEC